MAEGEISQYEKETLQLLKKELHIQGDTCSCFILWKGIKQKKIKTLRGEKYKL